MPERSKQSSAKRRPKLSRLPKGARIRKRPLLHPSIPSPYASSSSPKVVYISSRTPFLSAVKRVRKLLSLAEKRATQSTVSRASGDTKSTAHALPSGKSRSKEGRDDRILAAALATSDARNSGLESEEVTIKATGRSIEKGLNLALWFQRQEDCKVKIRTGTVRAIDDIEYESASASERSETEEKKGDDEVAEELPETRMRQTSVLEVCVSLR